MSKKRADGRTTKGQFAPGKSGNPSGVSPHEAMRRVAVAAGRADDWQNAFTGQGYYGRDKRIGTQFQPHTMSFDQLKDLWLGDDLAARAVETIPREAMRQGYDISIASGQDGSDSLSMDPAEMASEVTDKLTVLGADEYLEVCGGYERGFGGGALLLGANDQEGDLTKPLNLDKVKAFDWITPLEAREMMPLYAYSDPRAPKYGQPEIYQLSSRAVLPSYSGAYATTNMMIHESRLIVFPGIRVSRYQTTTARGGWGESILTRVFRVLRDFNTAWSSAGVLVSDFAQSVIKVSGLWEALATDGAGAFQKRLQAMELGRSAINALTIDAADTYERQQTPLSGLPDLLEKFAVRLAAACDMPLTLLFGTSPAGMNATGESDVRFFYDRVAAYQTRKIEPALRRLCQLIFRTIGNKREPGRWAVKFRPLWQDSAKDKAAAMLTQAQADSAWITAGVISPEEVATSHWGKGEYDPSLTIDFDARDSDEPAAPGPVSLEPAAPQPGDPDYIPPPPPGSAVPGELDTPGEELAAAPDPNTPPQNVINSEDSAEAIRHDGLARDLTLEVYSQLVLSRAASAEAETQVAQAKWDSYHTTSDRALNHAAQAARLVAQVAYHAQLGTAVAAEYNAAAQGMLRGDEWSEAAREAALETRQANAKGPAKGSDRVAAMKANVAAAHAAKMARPAPGRKSANTKPVEPAKAEGKSTSKAEPKEKPTYARATAAAQQHEAIAKTGGEKSSEHAQKAQESHAAAAKQHEAAAGERTKIAEQHMASGNHAEAREHFKQAIAAHAKAAASDKAAHGGKESAKGKEHKGKGESLGAKIAGFTKGAGEVIGGKESAQLAETIAPEGGGGEGDD